MPERTLDFLRRMLNFHNVDELPIGSMQYWRDVSIPDSSEFLFLVLRIDETESSVSLKMYTGRHSFEDYAPPWDGAKFQKERILPAEMCDQVREELTPLDWTLSKISGRKYLQQKKKKEKK